MVCITDVGVVRNVYEYWTQLLESDKSAMIKKAQEHLKGKGSGKEAPVRRRQELDEESRFSCEMPQSFPRSAVSNEHSTRQSRQAPKGYKNDSASVPIAEYRSPYPIYGAHGPTPAYQNAFYYQQADQPFHQQSAAPSPPAMQDETPMDRRQRQATAQIYATMEWQPVENYGAISERWPGQHSFTLYNDRDDFERNKREFFLVTLSDCTQGVLDIRMGTRLARSLGTGIPVGYCCDWAREMMIKEILLGADDSQRSGRIEFNTEWGATCNGG